jgi:drug/metabolite transporter (DMT)-like permease
VTSLYI